MNVDKYLNHIQKNESIFPIDSFPRKKKKKKKQILRTVYPEQLETNKFPKEKKRIMIDVDGVLHTYSNGWNEGKLGKIIPGSKEALDQLHKNGFEIVIFTSRAAKQINIKPTSEKLISDLKIWLDKNKVYYDKITGEKLNAVAYIDDRAIRFENNWPLILSKVKQL